MPTVSASADQSATGALHSEKAVCAKAAPGYANCHAHVVTKNDGVTPNATTTRGGGYISADLRAAYKLSTDSTATVAIVDAYANPNAESDLIAYRTNAGVKPLVAGQFTQVNQNGQVSPLATADVGWGQEEMLDLEMVSAICPSCKILYVGANSASFADLGAAVNTAADPARGVSVISNSYGGGEFSGETTTQAAYYTHPNIAITVSSGDSGYGVQIPAAFSTVTAVGGTSLTQNSTTRGWGETVWSGAGSGCSAYVGKPSWQHDTGCMRRTVADVAAVADPNTGVAVYDSYGSTGGANWYVFGGTSVAAPIIGAVYALSGNTTGTGTPVGVPAQLAYSPGASLYDVTSGSNTRRCRAGYLCSGATGYDGPTGNGTPNTAAF